MYTLDHRRALVGRISVNEALDILFDEVRGSTRGVGQAPYLGFVDRSSPHDASERVRTFSAVKDSNDIVGSTLGSAGLLRNAEPGVSKTLDASALEMGSAALPSHAGLRSTRNYHYRKGNGNGRY